MVFEILLIVEICNIEIIVACLGTLNFATSVLALVTGIEVISVISTATVDELLANTFSAIVEPFSGSFLTGSLLLR